MTEASLIQWIKELGLQTVALVAIAYGAVKVARWMAANVVVPLTTRTVSRMDAQDARDEKQTEILATLTGEVTRVREMATEHFEACELVHSKRATS